jgi:GntR family transcriptional repressor for pyruvate dehydrogenase complex
VKKELQDKLQDDATPHSQLTMQVVEHVRSLIAAGEVKPGDRLPPERELARKLKISRSSLRAGIGFLSAMGVLKSRHGAEMYAALDDPQEYLIHDVRFHRTIARAAANPILAALMETITANLYERRSLTVQNAQDLKESAEMHREIYRAIRSHNPTLARQTMEQHLNLARTAQAAEADVPPPSIEDDTADLATESKA